MKRYKFKGISTVRNFRTVEKKEKINGKIWSINFI